METEMAHRIPLSDNVDFEMAFIARVTPWGVSGSNPERRSSTLRARAKAGWLIQ